MRAEKNRSIIRWHSAVVGIIMLAVVAHVYGETNLPALNNAGVSQSNCKAFFKNVANDMPEEFLPYLTLAEKPAPMKGTANEGMVDCFWGYMQLSFKMEQMPSENYVRKNLQLYPADKTCAEDRALLLFRKDNDDFMIAETGTTGGRTFLFIKKSGPVVANQEQMLALGVAAMRKYFRIPDDFDPQNIVGVKTGTVVVLNGKGLFRGAVCANEIALTFEHFQLGDDIEEVYKENEWLEYADVSHKIALLIEAEITNNLARQKTHIETYIAGDGGLGQALWGKTKFGRRIYGDPAASSSSETSKATTPQSTNAVGLGTSPMRKNPGADTAKSK